MAKDMDALLEGYQKFREHYYGESSLLFEDLVRRGQRPKVLMVACSDSRVDPALVLNSQPGDLFMVRNVANLIPPFEDDQAYHGTSAALEFGICVLGIRHVILFGHTQCGGIQSLLESSPGAPIKKSFITKWMELARPAQQAVLEFHAECSLEEKTTLCGQYSLINSLQNLLTFPWISEKVQQGSLFLHAWNFDLSKGHLEAFDVAENRFKDINVL
ncbi:MAG: carbonic anhydrase [Alphaproteobacteria bacterium]|nr:carbonic anhydrase [Alphaproteobacteria bacterium]